MNIQAAWNRVEADLESVYGNNTHDLLQALKLLAAEFSGNTMRRGPGGRARLSESSAALICYADSIVDSTGTKTPIQALTDVVKSIHLARTLPIVHLLPFFPWDTDRGFSVKDYYQVDPHCGSWDDLRPLAKEVELMFDFVANHASIENPLVQRALIARHLSSEHPLYAEAAPYLDFVIAYSEDELPDDAHLQALARPRPNPVLTRYSVIETPDNKCRAILGEPSSSHADVLGQGYVWTTFSRPKNQDGTEATRQVDLNFKNPKVFLESLRILLFYVERGASLIRLDAIGYIWKRLGSTSLHEPEVHALLAATKEVLTLASPHVITIAEVNEPQDKAFTYLGTTEKEESDLVYQFAHFPLAIHALLTQNGQYYTEWLSSLFEVDGRQFVTVLGSHDGLGLKPVRNILPEEELERLSSILIEEHGGRPNYASLPGGQQIVYEICGTPWDLINNSSAAEPFELQKQRYLAVVGLGLLVRGLPAFYINGVFGTRNYTPDGGLDENRTVNREVFSNESLLATLKDRTSHYRNVFEALQEILLKRSTQPAFGSLTNPTQPIQTNCQAVVAAVIPGEAPQDALLCLVNVSSDPQEVVIETDTFEPGERPSDILSGAPVSPGPNGIVNASLAAYQIAWIKRR